MKNFHLLDCGPPTLAISWLNDSIPFGAISMFHMIFPDNLSFYLISTLKHLTVIFQLRLVLG